MCFWRRRSIVDRLNEIKEIIVATREENQAAIDAFVAQLNKAKQEIVDQVAKLEEAATAGQELDFTGLRNATQELDDLNADAIVPEPEAPAEGE
ncbi:hypothetical protein SEA_TROGGLEHUMPER_60 [Rhodococcus phage Trogglehumper]|uniref:Uncharacterized protein n=1 Tax=Rhodococcus phage Trogglehumper TaxID=3038381 RepID=A0AAF0GIH7_9CAUD|nr:hypothetical protein SEA_TROGGLEHUMPER_60 [Rhodococcus phage Trogglehumper]